jgi:hypothetical protein
MRAAGRGGAWETERRKPATHELGLKAKKWQQYPFMETEPS